MADLIAMLSAAAGVDGGAAVDPNFNQTTLLLHGDGTNGAQNNTFLDSSTNNFTITRNGNTTQGTFSPFSLAFSVPNDVDFDFGSGAFTIEAWARPTTASQLAFAARGQSTGFVGWILSTTNFLATTNGSTWNITITFTSPLVANSWNHVAVVRNGDVYTAYLNGVANGTTTVSGSIVAGTAATIIGQRAGQTDYSGYIANFRIVKGTAVYTAAFTPSTTPLTNITNTSLLTCQSNRFVDNSANAFAITVNGNTSVQPFSPFAPSAAYSPSVNGGSGYFDGSGDYLSAPPSLTLAGDLTCEFWTNVNAIGGSNAVAWISTDVGDGFQIGCSSGGTFEFYGGGSSQLSASVSISLFIKTWLHVALVRSGTTLSLYLNGSRVATATYATSLSISTLYVGSQGAGSSHLLNGYISSLRIINGTGPYDATQTTLTIPTAPLTAVTNTQLLTNFTNAGIFDNTGKNNLETVADAQIDTTTKKWGTGSLWSLMGLEIICLFLLQLQITCLH
jgi:hypothetical protein